MLKKSFIAIIILCFILPTIMFCILKPQMHKQFQFNILEYAIKFNKDGSATMTETITKTEVRNINK